MRQRHRSSTLATCIRLWDNNDPFVKKFHHPGITPDMYVVTVHFDVHSDCVDAFRDAMRKQASNSLKLEGGCRQFDVCFDSQDPTRCFLYERYDDRAAFDAHLASDHFQQFDQTVADWVISKTVQVWQQDS